MQQLELLFLSQADVAPPRMLVSAVLQRHRSKNEVLRMVAYVRRYFPELDSETVTVGLTRAASGMAVPGGKRIWLNPSRLSYHTISHELIHLLQCRDLAIPAGEKACDVFSFARHWTLNDERPSYVKVPREIVDERGRFNEANAKLLFAVAREAITQRNRGLRNYISFFEAELARRVDAGDTAHKSALRLLHTV
jgi:hypothetical protein